MTIPEDVGEPVRVYAKQREITISKSLGFGQDGAVWRASQNTAVMALERERTSLNERDANLLLRDQRVSRIGDFAVPVLRGYDDELRIVEIAIVTPPYTAEQIDKNLEICRELFEPADWYSVESALTDLAMLGIAYLEIKPANIRVR